MQRVRTLDHGIEALGRRPVRKLDPPVRAALRLGAYQLAFMDGVPAHARSNETVELVRAARLERAVAFTNAVMRRLAEGLPDLLAAPARGNADRRGAHALLSRLDRGDVVARVGPDDARALMRAQNEPPEIVAVRATPEVPAQVVDAIPPEWLESGYAWPQSRGSQLAGGRSARARASACWISARLPGQSHAARGRRCRGRRGREAPGPGARAGGERAATRRDELTVV